MYSLLLYLNNTSAGWGGVTEDWSNFLPTKITLWKKMGKKVTDGEGRVTVSPFPMATADTGLLSFCPPTLFPLRRKQFRSGHP